MFAARKPSGCGGEGEKLTTRAAFAPIAGLVVAVVAVVAVSPPLGVGFAPRTVGEPVRGDAMRTRTAMGKMGRE